jgi:tetratricopeptide (TPR) repeat protein
MDLLPLKTYYFGTTKPLRMKQASRLLLSSLLCFALLPTAAEAAKGKHSGGAHRPAGAGVMLQTPEPQSALDHNNRGVELGSKGIWPDAIKEHEIALAMQPGNKDFRTNLSSAQLHYGNTLFKRQAYYEAIKQFRGALFVDPDNLPADEGLDECFKKMVGDKAFDVEYRRKIAGDLEGKGLFEDAIVEYRKVVKMSDSGKSHADLADVFLKADKPVEAFQEYRISVQKPWGKDESNALSRVHRQMADMLMEYAYKARDSGRGSVGMKRLMNAVTEYKRAVTLNPEDHNAIGGFIDAVRECTALRPTFDNTLMLAGAYLLGGDFAHAKLAYEQCYKIDPRRTELEQARVAYHKSVAKSANASDELVMESMTKVQKFLENDPDNARWLYIFGRLKQHMHDNDGAMEAYRRAEKINPFADPDLEMQIKVLGGAPDSPMIAGQAPTNGGNPSNAIATAGSGGTTNPSSGSNSGSIPVNSSPPRATVDPRKLATYSQIEQLMSSNPDEGMSRVEELLNKTPSDAHAWLLKGDLLRKKGQLDEAAAAFRTASGLGEADAADMMDNVNTIRVQPNLQEADKFLQLKDYVQAADQLQTALIKAPNLSAVHRKYAEVLRQMNDVKGAEREEKKAQDLETKKK